MNPEWPRLVSWLPEAWRGLSLSVSRSLKEAWFLVFILIGSAVSQFSLSWLNMFQQLIAEAELWGDGMSVQKHSLSSLDPSKNCSRNPKSS